MGKWLSVTIPEAQDRLLSRTISRHDRVVGRGVCLQPGGLDIVGELATLRHSLELRAGWSTTVAVRQRPSEQSHTEPRRET